jgi:hypothetical protein
MLTFNRMMKFTNDNRNKLLFARLKFSILVVVVICLILFIPYKTTIVPEWKIRAVDGQGKPLPHTKFRQGWDNYSYDISGMEFWEGDDNGYVVLPERSFYAPLAYRILHTGLAYIAAVFLHGSIGNSASLNAVTDKCSSEHLNYEKIKSLPAVIVIDCPTE